MRERRAKRLLVAAVILFSVAALWSSGNAANVDPTLVTADFCSDCESQCYWDTYSAMDGYYWQCASDPTNSEAYCSMKARQRYNNCISVFCNYAGCSIPLQSGRVCRSGLCF